MNCIIGINSAVVKSLGDLGDEYTCISHLDVATTNFNSFDNIFLFSWSNTDYKQNLLLLDFLPLGRVIFISTIAVMACAVRRQWAKYPNWKKSIEDIIVSEGGKVIRLGFCDASVLNKLYGVVPFTTPEDLRHCMKQACLSDKQFHYPIKLMEGTLGPLKTHVSVWLNKISGSFPNLLAFQLPILMVSRLAGLGRYSYTHDCMRFFSHRLLIGYGAIGSVVATELDKKGLKHDIMVSGKPNLLLNDNGFLGTRIGHNKEGLSRYWHGVSIRKHRGKFYKNVPVFVSRPRVPKRALMAHANAISQDFNLLNIELDSDTVSDLRYFSLYIHLAAGALNNIKILRGIDSSSDYLNDHEVGEIGDISTSELIELGILKKIGPLIIGREVKLINTEKTPVLLDFRPMAKPLVNNDNLYNNKISIILVALFRNFSLKRFNQAFFNKFGLSIFVKRFSIITQLEAFDAINITEKKELKRTRIHADVYTDIQNILAQKYKTFEPREKIFMYDAIHILGSLDCDSYPNVLALVEAKKLFLHGIDFGKADLGPFHHTTSLQEVEREKIRRI